MPRVCAFCVLLGQWLVGSASSYAGDIRPFADLHEHLEEIVFIAFSPDGKILLSGDTAGKVSLWNSKARQLIANHSIRDLEKPDRFRIKAIAVSKTNQTLATLDEMGLIRMARG